MLFDHIKVMHEVVNLCLSEGNRGVPTLKACEHVANLVQQEVGAISDSIVPCALFMLLYRCKFRARSNFRTAKTAHRPSVLCTVLLTACD